MKKTIGAIIFAGLVWAAVCWAGGAVQVSGNGNQATGWITKTFDDEITKGVRTYGYDICAANAPYQVSGTVSYVTLTGISGRLLGYEITPDDIGNNVFTGDNQPTGTFNFALNSDLREGTLGNADTIIAAASALSPSVTTRMISDTGVYLYKQALVPTILDSSIGTAKKIKLKLFLQE